MVREKRWSQSVLDGFVVVILLPDLIICCAGRDWTRVHCMGSSCQCQSSQNFWMIMVVWQGKYQSTQSHLRSIQSSLVKWVNLMVPWYRRTRKWLKRLFWEYWMVSDVGEGVWLDVLPHGQLYLEKVLNLGNVTNVVHIIYHVMQ